MQHQYGVTEETVLLIPGPIYHAAPMGWSQGCQAIGGTVVPLERFDAEVALAAIARYGVTHALFVPTHFVRMLNLPEAVRARYDVSSLRRVVHSAAPCPPHVKRAMIEWFGPIIDEYYSATEAAGFTVVDSETWLRKPGTVGRPLSGIPHILDEDGHELPVGETGAVYFEGVDSFEYHGDPGKTSEFFNDRGWGCNGDMGWLDEDGYLFLADRRSHMIISGGVNIYPQESENVLFEHLAVADVAVIGVPNDEYGEEVKAVVELRPEAGGGTTNWPRSSWPSAVRSWPTTSARSPSTSWRNCRARRRARCANAISGRPTGPRGASRSSEWCSGGHQAVGPLGVHGGDEAAVGHHGGPVVVPVGVLAVAGPVVGDELLDRVVVSDRRPPG